jgi:ketosteroid isomerase-like protein
MTSHMELVQRIFRGFVEDQSVDTLLANVTEDVLFQNTAHSTIPFGGDFRGVAGILDYFAKVGACVAPHTVRVTGYFEGEDGIVVLGDEVLRVLATGEEFPSVWCTVFHFRDSLISRVRVIEHHSSSVLALAKVR